MNTPGAGPAHLLIGFMAALLAIAIGSVPTASAQAPDYPIVNGWFFTQGASDTRDPRDGFAVVDDEQAQFWSAFQDRGGVAAVGYPISRRFSWDGFTTQVMQKAVLQWRPESQSTVLLNVFDDLSRRGHDQTLEGLLVPEAETFAGEDSLSLAEIVRKRTALLEAEPRLLAAYRSVSDPLLTYGLPTSRVRQYQGLRAIRLQRAVLQLWTSDFPWASAGTVTIANGGDLAKQVGMFSGAPLLSEAAGDYAGGAYGSQALDSSVVGVVLGASSAVVRIEGSPGWGSGFLIDSDGHILTTAHVVKRAGSMVITLQDGTKWNPEVVGVDSGRDIALLKITTPYPLPFLELASAVAGGDSVVALGSPPGLFSEPAITTGLVSSVAHKIGQVTHVRTDAAIGPDSSGGPLLNLGGQAVGMNTSAVTGPTAQGAGFAIRYDVLSDRLPTLWSGNLVPTPPPAPTNSPAPD